MRTVHRYPIKSPGHTQIETHGGATPLHAGITTRGPNIWLEVDTEKPTTLATIHVAETGEEINPWESYVGTFFSTNREFVWHVYFDILEGKGAWLK